MLRLQTATWCLATTGAFLPAIVVTQPNLVMTQGCCCHQGSPMPNSCCEALMSSLYVTEHKAMFLDVLITTYSCAPGVPRNSKLYPGLSQEPRKLCPYLCPMIPGCTQVNRRSALQLQRHGTRNCAFGCGHKCFTRPEEPLGAHRDSQEPLEAPRGLQEPLRAARGP